MEFDLKQKISLTWSWHHLVIWSWHLWIILILLMILFIWLLSIYPNFTIEGAFNSLWAFLLKLENACMNLMMSNFFMNMGFWFTLFPKIPSKILLIIKFMELLQWFVIISLCLYTMSMSIFSLMLHYTEYDYSSPSVRQFKVKSL